MKSIFLIFFLSYQITAKGQNNVLREFVNQVAKEVILNNANYYNLIDSSFVIKLDKYTFEDDTKSFLKSYPDFPLELTQRVSDSTIIDWKKLQLENVKYYSNNNLPRHYSASLRISRIADAKFNQNQIDSINNGIPSSELFVKIKPKWKQKRIQKEYQKAWDRNDKIISKENNVYYTFSTPQFSVDKKYAIISIKIGSSGSILIFKKTEVGWKKIYKFNIWVGQTMTTTISSM